MDADIINAFKVHYRGNLVCFIVDATDGDRPTRVEISDAIRWTKLSWDEVTANTIINSWRHTCILQHDEPRQPQEADNTTVASAEAATTMPPPTAA